MFSKTSSAILYYNACISLSYSTCIGLCNWFSELYAFVFVSQTLWFVRQWWWSSVFYWCITRTPEAAIIVNRWGNIEVDSCLLIKLLFESATNIHTESGPLLQSFPLIELIIDFSLHFFSSTEQSGNLRIYKRFSVFENSLLTFTLYLQGQMLTLVEYLLLLYRALLPTPVWYRFFLNKEYGSLFSSLLTGLYLTFKLTSVVEKVCFLLFWIFLTHFYYYYEHFVARWSLMSVISLPCLIFLSDVDFRCNPSLLPWKRCLVKRCIMGHMQRQSR